MTKSKWYFCIPLMVLCLVFSLALRRVVVKPDTASFFNLIESFLFILGTAFFFIRKQKVRCILQIVVFSLLILVVILCLLFRITRMSVSRAVILLGCLFLFFSSLSELVRVTATFDKALYFEKNGKFKKAIRIYSIVLMHDRDNAYIRYNRGYLYDKAGQYRKAERDFMRSSECPEPDPKSFMALGVYRFENNQMEEAVVLAKKALSMDPSLDSYIPKGLRDSFLLQRD